MNMKKRTIEIPENVTLTSRHIEHFTAILETFSPRDIEKTLQEVWFQYLMKGNDPHIEFAQMTQIFYTLIGLFQEIEKERIESKKETVSTV